MFLSSSVWYFEAGLVAAGVLSVAASFAVGLAEIRNRIG